MPCPYCNEPTPNDDLCPIHQELADRAAMRAIRYAERKSNRDVADVDLPDIDPVVEEAAVEFARGIDPNMEAIHQEYIDECCRRLRMGNTSQRGLLTRG